MDGSPPVPVVILVGRVLAKDPFKTLDLKIAQAKHNMESLIQAAIIYPLSSYTFLLYHTTLPVDPVCVMVCGKGVMNKGQLYDRL